MPSMGFRGTREHPLVTDLYGDPGLAEEPCSNYPKKEERPE
jgi:hypothetical protein